MPLEFHEPRDQVPENVVDEHRAVTSMIEEFEAVLWYEQRAAVTTNQELKDILIHNRNEEREHAMMLLEWVRRNIDGFDEEMRTYLFKNAPITELESLAEGHEGGENGEQQTASDGSLNIGSLKGGKTPASEEE
ncbi:MAG: ferritin [Planctomycetes bacterium]|jgi:ferritin-like protein|nr:ferritin [Phycisphaerae bacterium]NBB94817.1 ferritin [Planctomycetota bacterium]